jgi:hypothetical protein
MASRNQNRFNSFEPKHWQERAEDDSDDTDDASDDMNGSADDFEEPEDGQVTSQTSDDDLSTDENLGNDSVPVMAKMKIAATKNIPLLHLKFRNKPVW